MIRLPGIFKDGAVLQRGKRVCVWGESDAPEVTLTLTRKDVVLQKRYARVRDGKFSIKLYPQNAGGPCELLIQAGREEVRLRDLYYGEVFLLGGQTDMGMPLQKTVGGPEEAAIARCELLRYYETPRFARECEELQRAEEESIWQECTPETVPNWSAIGYYVGNLLVEKLGVMIGLIGCNYGGTSSSCWVSRETLQSDPDLIKYLEQYEGPDDETNTDPKRPCGLHGTMIRHIAPFTLAGFLFYQGSEDDNRPFSYEFLLRAMIQEWRMDWSDLSLPFLMVQMPACLGEEEIDYGNLPFIREAQEKIARTSLEVDFVTAYDLGDKYKVHPAEKKEVAKRLTKLILFRIFDQIGAEEAIAPYYKKARFEGPEVTIEFGGPTKLVEKGEVTGFEIAGADREYVPAKAVISEHEAVLSAEGVERAVYARYLWKNYAEVTLFGENGLPATPFRTGRDDGAVATGSRQGDIR